MAKPKKLYKVVPRFDHTTSPTTCMWGIVSTTPIPNTKGDDRWPLIIFAGHPAVFARKDVALEIRNGLEHEDRSHQCFARAAEMDSLVRDAVGTLPSEQPAPEAA